MISFAMDSSPTLFIGILAALIAALGTIFGVWLKGRLDAKTERHKRRFEILDRCAREFEKASASFITLSSTYYGYLGPPKGPNDEIQRHVEAALLHSLWEKIDGMVGKEINAALHSLNEIDVSLLLIGCMESSKSVERYRHLVTDLQAAIIPRDDMNSRPLLTIGEWNARIKHMADARVEVVNRLRED